MAKFQRLGPVWRKPRPKPWKQLKACAAWANERQAWADLLDLEPPTSATIEIEMADGSWLITESSNPADIEYITYIATEGS